MHIINPNLIVLLSLLPFGLNAQSRLICLKSNAAQVKIIENEIIETEWNLDPQIKLDVYYTGKVNDIKSVKIVSDIDSLMFHLKPNEKLDFVILKGAKDSCFTRIQTPQMPNYAQLDPIQHEAIGFELTPFNNIKVKALLNGEDSIYFNFDSGATGLYLTKKAIQKYFNPNNFPLTMADLSENTFRLGDIEWTKQQIYPIEITSQETDGMFGWDLFDGKIIEINYDKNVMTVHSKLPQLDNAYERFAIEYMKEHFRIEIAFIANKKKIKGKFLFDTGFQKACLLDRDLLVSSSINTNELKVLANAVLLNSRKEEIHLKTVAIDAFIFGKYILKNVPSELNDYSKPALYDTHFLGCDILKRFNVILDFQNDFVYL